MMDANVHFTANAKRSSESSVNISGRKREETAARAASGQATSRTMSCGHQNGLDGLGATGLPTVNGMWDDGDHNFNVSVAGGVEHDCADLAAAGWAGVVVFTEHAPSEFEAGATTCGRGGPRRGGRAQH